MKINREELLRQLESVMSGLSPRELIEQSSCFIFKGKTVHTYNDEISCSQKSLLRIEGAVPAIPFISILRKLQEDKLDMTLNEGKSELLIKGKRRRVGVTMEAEVTLPVDEVERPREWRNLPGTFADAVAIVQPCAGKEVGVGGKSWVPFIHIAPKWIEASNMYQVARFGIKTGLSKSLLIREESLKHILNLDMMEFSETKHWIHFRNSTGLVLSCRYWIEDYPSDEMTEILKVKGESLVLPKGLEKEIEKAEVFSSENIEGSNGTVILTPGKFKIKGLGASGWYEWRARKIDYDGRELEFTVPSKLLSDLVKQYSKCEVSENRLKIKGSRFVYVTVLGMVEEVEND